MTASEQGFIDERYHVVEVLGRGNMGVIYRCHDLVLNRFVAVKQIAARLGDDCGVRSRFTSEALAMARLRHPHVVQVYDLHDTGTSLCIVMEALDGTALDSYTRATSLSLADKLSLLVQLCDGLAHAHAHGVIHRDIKPSNLVVSDGGHLTILDFGVAHLASSHLTLTGQLLGTPAYMAPEGFHGRETDVRADLYSVGVVAYELLTGSRPFTATTLPHLMHQVTSQDPVRISLRLPDLPRQLATLIDRLLSRTPDERPSSALEARDTLLSFAEGAATISTRTERTRTRGAPHISATGAIAACALAGGGLLVTTWSWNSSLPIPTESPREAPSLELPIEQPPPLSVTDRASARAISSATKPAKHEVSSSDHPSREGAFDTAKGEKPQAGAPQTLAAPAAPTQESLSHNPGPASGPEAESVPSGPGSVRILGTAGADVSLNGIRMGRIGSRGDLLLSALPAGTYDLVVRSATNEARRSVAIEDGHTAVVDIRHVPE